MINSGESQFYVTSTDILKKFSSLLINAVILETTEVFLNFNLKRNLYAVINQKLNRDEVRRSPETLSLIPSRILDLK